MVKEGVASNRNGFFPSLRSDEILTRTPNGSSEVGTRRGNGFSRLSEDTRNRESDDTNIRSLSISVISFPRLSLSAFPSFLLFRVLHRLLIDESADAFPAGSNGSNAISVSNRRRACGSKVPLLVSPARISMARPIVCETRAARVSTYGSRQTASSLLRDRSANDS